MGCFDYNCAISGLPIGWNVAVRFMILAQNLTSRCRGAHDVEGAWRLLAPPMRARYNNALAERRPDGVSVLGAANPVLPCPVDLAVRALLGRIQNE